MRYPEVTPKTIWNFRQNNPELIIQDLGLYLDLDDEQKELVRKVLLARGVNKWFKVRRDLIAYKKQMRNTIKALYSEHNKENKELIKLAESVRHNLKVLCKTDRWQIWPRLGSHHKELRAMNTLTASD